MSFEIRNTNKGKSVCFLSHPESKIICIKVYIYIMVVSMRNVLHSFRHSNSWFSVGGVVLRGLGNAALLEEVCNYGELCKHV